VLVFCDPPLWTSVVGAAVVVLAVAAMAVEEKALALMEHIYGNSDWC